MNNTRYYLTQRAPTPGAFPTNPRVTGIRAFLRKEYVEAIERKAWGWVEYGEPLTQKQVDDYELVKGE